MGSWKIMAISLPRTLRRLASGSASRSWPRNRIWPPSYTVGGTGLSCRMLMAVTLLPQPDSPTTPSVSPRAMPKLTPSTARTTPSSVWKCVRRSRISSRGSAISGGLQARVERVAHALAEQVVEHHGQEDDEAREDLDPPVLRAAALDEQAAPGRDRELHAEAEEGQRRLGEDAGGDREGGRDQHGTQRIGQDVPEDRAPVPGAEGLAGHHEVLLAQAQELAAHEARDGRPARDAQDDHDVDDAGAVEGHDDEDQEEDREALEDLDHAAQQEVDPASEVAGERADDDADHDQEGGRDQSHRERDPPAPDHARQHVAP